MSSEHVSDEEVMRLVIEEGSEPLEILVRRYATRLLTFLCRLVGDVHRAEELFQETFLLVWTKRATYTYPRPFKSWLFTVALNATRAALRSRQLSIVSLESGFDPMTDSTPSERLVGEEKDDEIQRALLRLPPQQREVVTLRIWEELPYSRIAELVEAPEGTVRSHMHHALASLRRDLSARGVSHD